MGDTVGKNKGRARLHSKTWRVKRFLSYRHRIDLYRIDTVVKKFSKTIIFDTTEITNPMILQVQVPPVANHKLMSKFKIIINSTCVILILAYAAYF